MISGLRHEINENCALHGNFTASSGNFLTSFRNYLWVPSSEAKSLLYKRTSKMGPIGCVETSVINYHYSVRINSEERSPLIC